MLVCTISQCLKGEKEKRQYVPLINLMQSGYAFFQFFLPTEREQYPYPHLTSFSEFLCVFIQYVPAPAAELDWFPFEWPFGLKQAKDVLWLFLLYLCGSNSPFN